MRLVKTNTQDESRRLIDRRESLHLYCLFALNTFFRSARLVPAISGSFRSCPPLKAERSLEFYEIKLKVLDENEQS
jgi:hypothetical protein